MQYILFLFCLYFPSVLNKGQCVTKYYRWMQKNGGYIWIQSSATIAVNAKNASEKNIIWVNYLLRYVFESFLSLELPSLLLDYAGETFGEKNNCLLERVNENNFFIWSTSK